jgi:hypothetical protein
MFHKYLFKDKSSSHLLKIGWYLDCPKDNIPFSKIALRESLKLGFMEKVTSLVGT